jgi:hypothetical protein
MADGRVGCNNDEPSESTISGLVARKQNEADLGVEARAETGNEVVQESDSELNRREEARAETENDSVQFVEQQNDADLGEDFARAETGNEVEQLGESSGCGIDEEECDAQYGDVRHEKGYESDDEQPYQSTISDMLVVGEGDEGFFEMFDSDKVAPKLLHKKTHGKRSSPLYQLLYSTEDVIQSMYKVDVGASLATSFGSMLFVVGAIPSSPPQLQSPTEGDEEQGTSYLITALTCSVLCLAILCYLRNDRAAFPQQIPRDSPAILQRFFSDCAAILQRFFSDSSAILQRFFSDSQRLCSDSAALPYPWLAILYSCAAILQRFPPRSCSDSTAIVQRFCSNRASIPQRLCNNRAAIPLEFRSDCAAIVQRLRSDCAAISQRFQRDSAATGRQFRIGFCGDPALIIQRLRCDSTAILQRLCSNSAAITQHLC